MLSGAMVNKLSPGCCWDRGSGIREAEGPPGVNKACLQGTGCCVLGAKV